MTEVLQRVREICTAVEVPLIADADTGYGNVINMRRTVREFEQAGAAGIHIEDQKSPKKCGQLSGKHVEPVEEMMQKIRAAVAARSDPDFVIIARTDAREILGLEEVIRRCRAYFEAGADAVFPMALEGEGEVVAVGREAPGPKMITATHGGKTPSLGLGRFGALGYRFVVYAMSPMLVAAHALQEALTAIRRDGTDAAVSGQMLNFKQLYDLVDIEAYEAWDQRFNA
jgi:methylisocitrate lyase